MKPVYLDLHIHTSENPNSLNTSYDVDTLLQKISAIANSAEFLISLTDHNAINKLAYLNLITKTPHVLLGVELHIRNYDEKPPYHCHIYFNAKEINETIINEINEKLDTLYPKKIITEDLSVPKLTDIINKFDCYDFMLLPHGGQSHRTFDKSIPEGVIFDTTLERSIYYNQFDGFTARSNSGLEDTISYFRRLGIHEFVNLVTGTDNYNPALYPNAKAEDAEPFQPTWMFSSPTFDGLRISLSEKLRFEYCDSSPCEWAEYIQKVSLDNDKIRINVDLTPGLNVVIGGSSSGKTLFVDSLHKKISSELDKSNYKEFGVENINVVNPSMLTPHYIHQNFIIEVLSGGEKGVNDIDIINKVFPIESTVDEIIRLGLAELKADLGNLIKNIKIIESCESDLSRIPLFTRLITSEEPRKNAFASLLPSINEFLKYNYKESTYKKHSDNLKEIEDFVQENPFLESLDGEFQRIKQALDKAYRISNFETNIREIIESSKATVSEILAVENRELQSKAENTEKLLNKISEYTLALKSFNETLNKISLYNRKCATKVIDIMGHKLSIENNFVLSKEKVLDVINTYLKREYQIASFENISPQSLYESKFRKQQPKVDDYDDFEHKVYSDFEKMNQKNIR